MIPVSCWGCAAGALYSSCDPRQYPPDLLHIFYLVFGLVLVDYYLRYGKIVVVRRCSYTILRSQGCKLIFLFLPGLSY
jgi:hypothetical protein